MQNNLKKLGIICLVMLSFSLKVSAPCWNSFTIYEFSPAEPFKNLERAIGMVETNCNLTAYNPYEEAVGIFQIRPIRLLDYNIRTHSKYTTQDLYTLEVSEKIFLYYADLTGPYNLEQIARNWNGSGQLTDFYWTRIRQLL